jgi:hypothetical protein
LVSQAELYRFEVKKIDRDPRWLTTIAPPTLRASIHLFILGFLVWISIIYPAFAFDLKRPLVRDYSIILAVTGLWFFIWRSAKREDQKRLKKYESVLICSTCRIIL